MSFKIRKNCPYVTVKQIQELMKEGKPIPTAIFLRSRRKSYIVPDRTIFSKVYTKKGRFTI